MKYTAHLKIPDNKVIVNQMNENNKISTLLIAVLCVLTLPNMGYAQEYEPWTGAVPGENILLDSGDELIRVRKLINEGKTSDAVRLAKRYVESFSINERSGRTSSYLYDGYNALCISLTADKQFSEAMEACNIAIEHSPNRWQTINSRGSLNYISENFEAALRDYKKAYEMSPNVDRIKKILEHNIKISQARVDEN